MGDTQRAGLFRRIVTVLTAIGLLASSIAPASAQSFGDIFNAQKGSVESRNRRLTPAKIADAQAAKALFARISDATRATTQLPPAASNEVYDPKNPRRAAELRAALAAALDAYDAATIAEERVGTPVDPAILARLRDAVTPFVAFLASLAKANNVAPARTLIVPPGQIRTYDLSAYCMDASLPAPGNGETFKLQPAAQLIPPELLPLYSAMMTKPGSHDPGTQGLIWAIRNAYKNGWPVSLTSDALQDLDKRFPGAAEAIGKYNRRIESAKAVRGLIDAVLPGARSLVSQVQALDPTRMVENTRAQLAALERMPVAGAVEQDAAYTTLAPGIAARTTSPWGGASRARIEIANTTDAPYQFVPSDWVAASPRATQHLALQVPSSFTTGDAASGFQLPIAALVSAGLDFSVLGNIKAAIQAITGRDLITGEDTNRWLELASIIPVVGQMTRAERIFARTAPKVLRDTVELARRRQSAMLVADRGFNISPLSWDAYPSIGRAGTFLTDRAAIEDVIGPINHGAATLGKSDVTRLESALGLDAGTLEDGFKIREVSGITGKNPRSPLEGNSHFRGPGQHLPGGGPELVIDSVPTRGSPNVRVISEVKIR